MSSTPLGVGHGVQRKVGQGCTAIFQHGRDGLIGYRPDHGLCYIGTIEVRHCGWIDLPELAPVPRLPSGPCGFKGKERRTALFEADRNATTLSSLMLELPSNPCCPNVPVDFKCPRLSSLPASLQGPCSKVALPSSKQAGEHPCLSRRFRVLCAWMAA